jgi:diguanylate cyclase (GGDEF)-like protein/PAS domain S-box-containing protein
MMAWINRLQAHPIFAGNEKKTRRAWLLNTTLLLVILYVTLLIVSNLIGKRTPPVVIFIDVLILTTALVLRYFLFRGMVSLVGICTISLGILLVSASMVSMGTIRTPTTAILLFLVIVGGILYGTAGALFTTIASSAVVGVMILAENAGLLPEPDYTVTITQWLTYTFLFALAGFLTYFAYQTTLNSLMSAQKEIEERKRADEALRESEMRWQFALEGSGDGLWDWNAQTNTVYFSPRWKTMLGYAINEIGDTLDEWDERIHPADRDYVYAELKRHFDGETENYASEHRVRCKDGTYKWVLDRGKVISHTPDGKPLRVIGTHTDISERKRTEAALTNANEQLNLRVAEVERLQEELREQALHDPLTGLYNRRYLAEMLEHEIARSEREQTSLSIIVSDIDHFKDINDTCGHQTGDRFLVEIAALLRHTTRSSDLICRYGGEEFVLVFPGADSRSATQRAEDIRRKCSEIVIDHEGQGFSVTMSFGIAVYPEHGQTGEEVIIKADKALYASKQAGRNRVTVWG